MIFALSPFALLLIISSIVFIYGIMKYGLIHPVSIISFFWILSEGSVVVQFIYPEIFFDNLGHINYPIDLSLLWFISIIYFSEKVIVTFILTSVRVPIPPRLVFLKTQPLQEWELKRLALILLALGVAFWYAFFGGLSGLVSYWVEIVLRVNNGSGKGYLMTLAQFSLLLSQICALRCGDRVLIALTLLVSVILNASFGSKTWALIPLFIQLAVTLWNRPRGMAKLKASKLGQIMLVTFLSFFVFAGVNYGREVSKSDEVFSVAAVKGLAQRFGRVERDLLILSYVEKEGLWWGASYSSVIFAPVPRSWFQDKPPVDTGMYLRHVGAGRVLDKIPKPVSELSDNSWPEGNWSGYLNFGLPGYFVFITAAAFILKSFYGAARRASERSLAGIHLIFCYLIFAWYGIPLLSPAGLVNIASTLVFSAGLLKLTSKLGFRFIR